MDGGHASFESHEGSHRLDEDSSPIDEDAIQVVPTDGLSVGYEVIHDRQPVVTACDFGEQIKVFSMLFLVLGLVFVLVRNI